MANATPTLVTVTDVMPLRGPAAAVAYLLATARANGMRVNRTKLAKLLYLADLRAVERGLPPGSGVEWRRRNYGPHSRHLIEVESDLHEAGVIRVHTTEDPCSGYKECAIHLVNAPQAEIDAEFAEIINEVLADFGQWPAGQLRDHTYQTPPMQEAVRRGKREVRLDLTGGLRCRTCSPAWPTCAGGPSTIPCPMTSPAASTISSRMYPIVHPTR